MHFGLLAPRPRVTLTMRPRLLALSLALFVGACVRQTYTTSPAPEGRHEAASAGTTAASREVVGTTGNAPKDTPHLHFQVMRMPADGKYWDGEAINPYPLFLLMHAGRP